MDCVNKDLKGQYLAWDLGIVFSLRIIRSKMGGE